MVSTERSLVSPLNENYLNGNDNSNLGVTSEVSSREVVYRYLGTTDLSPEQIATTRESYQASAEIYSRSEWDPTAIKGMWEAIFNDYQDIILYLPPDAKILLTGVGTSRDLIFLALLRGDLKVIGSDISPGMLAVGQEHINWENIELLAKIIKEVSDIASQQGSPVFMINEVIEIIDRLDNLVKATDNQGNGKSVVNTDKILGTIHDRTFLIQEDIRRLSYPSECFDLAMAIGVLPHLKKDQVLPTLVEQLRVLRPGSILHCNLRADVERYESTQEGRTFMDTAMGGERFFTTYTLSEVVALVAELKAWFVMQGFPEVEVTIVETLTSHPDSHKPPFINIKIVKNHSNFLTV